MGQAGHAGPACPMHTPPLLPPAIPVRVYCGCLCTAIHLHHLPYIVELLLLHACAEEDEEEEEETSDQESYTDEGDEDADADADAGGAGDEDSGDDVVLMDDQPAAATRSRAAAGRRGTAEASAGAFSCAVTCHHYLYSRSNRQRFWRQRIWGLVLGALWCACRLGFGVPLVQVQH